MFYDASLKSAGMDPRFDIDLIKSVLKSATDKDGRFTQRGLAKAAGEGRDVVGDIINGRNKNPTIKVLSNLANAMDADISIFGASVRTDPPSVDELEQALAEHLPMAAKVAVGKRARFLAEVVADTLGLPASLPTSEAIERSQRPDDRGEGAPPPGSTN